MSQLKSKNKPAQSQQVKKNFSGYKVMIVGGFVVVILTSGAFVLGKFQTANLFSQSSSTVNVAAKAYRGGYRGGQGRGNFSKFDWQNNKLDESRGLMFASINQSERLPMTAGEEAGLVKMREEEKLARDVYLTLGKKYDLVVFNRIAQAEQRHMDLVGMLLNKYQIKDPVENDDVGVFSDQEVKQLYDKLVAKGLESSKEALLVGATIEDLDIYDLDSLIKENKNPDIKLVYERLLWGSENHLRAFSRNLNELGVTYQPEYISQSRYTQILSKSQGSRGGRRGRDWDRLGPSVPQ